MALDTYKLELDLYKSISMKIAEKEALSKNGYQQCIGGINSLNRILESIRQYKEKELSNDNLDKLGIDIEKHKLIIDGVNKLEQTVILNVQELKNRLLILQGHDQAYGASLEMIEKLSVVSKARAQSIEEMAKQEIEQSNESEESIPQNKVRKIGERPESLKAKRLAEDKKKKNGKNK